MCRAQGISWNWEDQQLKNEIFALKKLEPDFVGEILKAWILEPNSISTTEIEPNLTKISSKQQLQPPILPPNKTNKLHH